MITTDGRLILHVWQRNFLWNWVLPLKVKLIGYLQVLIGYW